MKLYQRLILFVLASTSIPMTVGLLVLRHSEDQLTARTLSASRESAGRLAESVGGEVGEVLERIQAALGYVDVNVISTAELKGLLGIVYKQSESIAQAVLIDNLGGEVVEPVFLADPDRFPEYAGRLGVSPEDHRRFLAALPLELAQSAAAGSAVLSSPRFREDTPPLLAVAIPIEREGGRWYLGVEVSLAAIVERLHDEAAAFHHQILLVDSDGHQFAGGGTGAFTERERASHPGVARAMTGQTRDAFLVGSDLVSFARVEPLGWIVVLLRLQSEAFSEVARARIFTLAWTGASILALLTLGLLFTRRIARNLHRLSAAAESFARGVLDTRVEIGSPDELGLLAATFNKMGIELKSSREEIEAWNRELALRVEQRTRELEIAHQRLLEASKLAAIGQLGAGVAHEINNPLVGILGNAQLLLLHQQDDETRSALQKIEASARRCREVVQNLLRFSEQEVNQEHAHCDLNQALKNAFSLTSERMASLGIRVEWRIEPTLPPVLGSFRQLVQVFLNLLSNAVTAMPQGGTLTISTCFRDGFSQATVEDTGRGIAPEHLERIFEPFFTTKDVWTNTGLGLSVAYRIVTDHGGRIEVESIPNAGSVFRVLLPAQPAEGVASHGPDVSPAEA